METSRIIEQLSVVAFGTSGETEKIIRGAMKHLDELECEYNKLTEQFADVCCHYAEDLGVLDDMIKEHSVLLKENENLWKKLTPAPVDVEVLDAEFDIIKHRCPCCGTRLFRDKAFCECCGQALVPMEQSKIQNTEGRIKEEQDLEDLINLNDRS